VYALWSFTLGLFGPHGRHLVYRIAYESPWLRPKLPQIPTTQMIGFAPRLTLLEAGSVLGNTSLLEQIVLVRQVELRQPRALFEFGTFDGRTALNLIAHAPPNARLYTLDLPPALIDAPTLPLEAGDRIFIDKPTSGTRFLGSEYAPRITQLHGDSATFDFSPYHGTIDFVFVDASHSYEYVLSDSRHALKLLRAEGGIIFWHDYSPAWPGVPRALDRLYREPGPFRNLRQVEGTTLAVLQVEPR
jgi:predicted O-methyltransferase YrrM